MKMIYKNGDYEVSELTIAGYPCQLHKTTSCGYGVQVPFGDNDQDKKMFDELVYFNKFVYQAETASQAIKQVRNWIKNYKKNG